MPAIDRDALLLAARTSGAAAGMILALVYDLDVAVAHPEHRGLLQALNEVLPPCRALAFNFPHLRGRVAGLVYLKVEYRRYTGSSALHVVAQIADLLLQATSALPGDGGVPPQMLDALAKELAEALPSSLDGDWLRTHLDPELAALGRDLGAVITDAYDQTRRPGHLLRIERKLSPLVAPPGRVVLAPSRRPSSSVGTRELTVDFPTSKLAIVTEGDTTAEVRGERRVWVFQKVVEAGGATVEWTELVRADVNRASEIAESRSDQRTGRMATMEASFQRVGNRIKESLGKLGYHWQQDGRGARWRPEVS